MNIQKHKLVLPNVEDIMYLRMYFDIPNHIPDEQVYLYIELWRKRNYLEVSSAGYVRRILDRCERKGG